MVKIRTTSGRESEFSRDILREWVTSRLGLSEERATTVVTAVEAEITELETVTSASLLGRAARHALTRPWASEDLAALPPQGVTVAGDVAAASYHSFSAVSKNFVPPALAPYVDCLRHKLTDGKGWEFQPPAGWKKEGDNDDDDASRIVGVAAGQVECCDAMELGFMPPGRPIPGLKFALNLQLTDRDSGGDSSGIDTVEVVAVKKDGDELRYGISEGSSWRLSTSQRDRSKTASVGHAFEMCIPCTALDNRRRAFFTVITTDGAGNSSVQVVSAAIPQTAVDQCCGAGGGAGQDLSTPGGGGAAPGGLSPPAGGAPVCPCYVKLVHVPVGGDSASSILGVLGGLLVSNPYNRTFYHSALEVQVVEGGECVRYVIELQNYVEGAEAQQNVGQVLSGSFGGVVNAFAGRIYGIRKWKSGTIEDAGTADPNPRLVTEDCTAAARILDLVTSIPTHDYATDWTSNSIISWLIQRAGLDPNMLPPPPGGIRPGWEEGAAAAAN